MLHGSLMLSTLLLLGCTGPIADEDNLPEAEAIFDKYVEASGGRTAFDKIYNRVTKGFMEPKGFGQKLSVTIYHAKPDKSYTIVEMGDAGKTEKGTDGKVAWENSITTGPLIHDGRRREDVIREATFDKWANWRIIYEKVECLGTAEVEGKTCYKVAVTPRYGKKKDDGDSLKKAEYQTLYFDKESHLPVRIDMKINNPAGPIPTEIYIGEYRKVDGILLPHKTRAKFMGQELVTTIISIEQNVDLPADLFDPPKEIKELLEQEKTERKSR